MVQQIVSWAFRSTYEELSIHTSEIDGSWGDQKIWAMLLSGYSRMGWEFDYTEGGARFYPATSTLFCSNLTITKYISYVWSDNESNLQESCRERAGLMCNSTPPQTSQSALWYNQIVSPCICESRNHRLWFHLASSLKRVIAQNTLVATCVVLPYGGLLSLLS